MRTIRGHQLSGFLQSRGLRRCCGRYPLPYGRGPASRKVLSLINHRTPNGPSPNWPSIASRSQDRPLKTQASWNQLASSFPPGSEATGVYPMARNSSWDCRLQSSPEPATTPLNPQRHRSIKSHACWCLVRGIPSLTVGASARPCDLDSVRRDFRSRGLRLDCNRHRIRRIIPVDPQRHRNLSPPCHRCRNLRPHLEQSCGHARN